MGWLKNQESHLKRINQKNGCKNFMLVNHKLKDKTIIAFEGVDGTGKTTISRFIAEKNNYRFIHCPPDDYSKYKNFYWKSF